MSENKPISFQTMLFKLQQFWADQGCLIAHPHNQQVGAGTMNPATTLRVLGPEPWNVAYLEPSVRPDDGRYGKNPNRLQQHMQLQVILKPDPGNPQELYLQSLAAIGIDPQQQDVRFVEDNWESPALGAWGLGWEVWLNGLEITQFTYFQQAGSLNTDPVSVEITYGLERLVMALQDVADFRDIEWADGISYGDLYLQSEQEHSAYYHELADIERLNQMYALYEAEFEAAIGAGLILPAYDYVLKCSQTFNILDTRGAVSVTERAGYFRRMRNMARKAAEAYVEQRQRLEYPFLRGGEFLKVETTPVDAGVLQWTLAGPLPWVLEIGTEELPHADLSEAIEQLRMLAAEMLAEARLGHGEIEVAGTPRRLALMVADVAPASEAVETEHRGPTASIAFDSDGNPTKAAMGFSRRHGLTPAQLERREINGKEYVVAVVHEPGRAAPLVLNEIAPQLVERLQFAKSMRWLPGAKSVAFSRPIRWLVSLLGETVVPFAYAGLHAGRHTRPQRALGDQPVSIPSAGAYLDTLASAAVQVMLHPDERRELIAGRAAELAAEVGGRIPDDLALLAEVTNLVEYPTVFRGKFAAEYLDLPREVLVAVMKKHQRYFPVLDEAGELLPYFIGVRNGGEENLAAVAHGNEHVIRARFADADYFVREDMKRALVDFRPGLQRLTFQKKLGSMLDKAGRVESLAVALAEQFGLEAGERATVARAAHLCKADLATEMVVEMTSLQGVLGRYYAQASGEPPEVAAAIEQHYWAGDGQQPDAPGLVVGLADRLDSLVGLFAAGVAPTGSADPYGMRRAAVGVIQLLLGAGEAFDLRAAVAAAAERQPVEVGDDVQQQTLEFIAGRLRGVLQDSGARYDVAEAALAARGHDPYAAQVAASQLMDWVAREDWINILDAYSRCVRITRTQTEDFAANPDLMEDPAEQQLWQAYQTAAGQLSPGSSVDALLGAFVPMIPAITAFFDHVLVMADDLAVRQNRLGLLQGVADLAAGVVDLSALEGF